MCERESNGSGTRHQFNRLFLSATMVRSGETVKPGSNWVQTPSSLSVSKNKNERVKEGRNGVFFLLRREAGVASWRRGDVRACRVWVCRTRIAAFNRAPSADKKTRFHPGSLTRCKFIFNNFKPGFGAPQVWRLSKIRRRKKPAALPALQRPPISRNILLVLGLPQVSLPICPPYLVRKPSLDLNRIKNFLS